MNGELSLNNYVVVTRNFGNFYVSKDRAERLNALLEMDPSRKPYKVDIDEASIVTSNILGIMTAAAYEDVEKQKKGMWKCGRGNWHERNEKCQCGWGMDTVRREEKKEAESTPEQKDRAALIILMRQEGLSIIRIAKIIKDKTHVEIKQMLKSYE